MARIELAPRVSEDFDRIVDHLLEHEDAQVVGRLDEILHVISILEANPLLGRPAVGELRELVIGRGARGYVALYRFIAEIDVVFILAIRAQREAGYRNHSL